MNSSISSFELRRLQSGGASAHLIKWGVVLGFLLLVLALVQIVRPTSSSSNREATTKLKNLFYSLEKRTHEDAADEAEQAEECLRSGSLFPPPLYLISLKIKWCYRNLWNYSSPLFIMTPVVTIFPEVNDVQSGYSTHSPWALLLNYLIIILLLMPSKKSDIFLAILISMARMPSIVPTCRIIAILPSSPTCPSITATCPFPGG